jgi:hypothetical protein
MCLHGYLVECVKQGVVGPKSIFPDINQQVFSVTTLIWGIILFLLNASQSLGKFLKTISPNGKHDSAVCQSFQEAVIAVARLPLYSLDEVHPFASTRIVVLVDDGIKPKLDSGLYGGIFWKWSKLTDGAIGNYSTEYQGDGVSRQFQLATPKALHLQHWD